MDFANEREIKYAHDILLGELPDFDEEKINIIKCNESKDIKACPGSGKTTTLLAKLVILAKRMPLSNGKGICVLTHTNVAIDEIKSKLNSQAEVLFNYPNYFGTIQGFVDKFLTIPYYNSVEENPLAIIDDERAKLLFLKAFSTKTFDDLKILWRQIQDRIPSGLEGKEKRSKIKEEQIRLLFNSFYDVYSKKYYREYGSSQALASNKAKALFQLLDNTRGIGLKEGILKYEDAFSYAMSYAKQCDNLKSAFSERFSYLFMDEMQDTNALQYDLIDMLFDSSNIIIQRFGDPHQNIFEQGNMKWKPNKQSLPINMSNRFGVNIASVLKTVCDVDNKSLKGNNNIQSLKPILLVYSEPETVLPYFANLVKHRTVEGKTILEISNYIKQKNPFNKCNIKAVGWVGKDKGGKTCNINSYYPNFEQKNKNNSGLIEELKLCDYLRKSDIFSVKIFTENIFTVLALVLELSGINYKYNGKSVRYTKSRVQTFIKNTYPEEYQALRSNISTWALNVLNSKSILNKDVYNQVKAYIDGEFQRLFKFDNKAPKYLDFISEPETSLCRKFDVENVRQNIFVSEDVEIEVSTVHSVKGESHVATLYMETSFKGKCESQRIGEQLCGIPYTGSSINMKMSLRIAYVAMSRPRYMLCMAIQKENYKLLDSVRLSNLWEIIEI